MHNQHSAMASAFHPFGNGSSSSIGPAAAVAGSPDAVRDAAQMERTQAAVQAQSQSHDVEGVPLVSKGLNSSGLFASMSHAHTCDCV